MHSKRYGLLLAFALIFFFESNNSLIPYNVNYAQTPTAAPHKKDPALQDKGDRPRQKVAQPPLDSMSPRWKRDIVDTTAGADYLTGAERDVIIAVNLVRTDPAEYARRFLVPLRSSYQGRNVRAPGEIAYSTFEGIGALDESIKELLATRPMSPLFPKKGLTLAARDHARDQARTGATGHFGSDGSTDVTRMDRYGKWDISAGENISYGNEDAERIVTSLLIDDGVPSRGHRKNLLNGSFGFIGVAVGPHRVYGHLCVMDFAGSYR